MPHFAGSTPNCVCLYEPANREHSLGIQVAEVALMRNAAADEGSVECRTRR